jgi:hypothetical protein
VQVFVLMTCTLFVTAPIMIIGGLFFAIREDGPLSLILVVAIPILLLSVGQVALRMHPQFTKMQNRIDRVNQVLREQISGMRVVRAFVREPDEAVRFGKGNADLTETSLKTGRMMAVMFPAVLPTINISSVAAVYFGADRSGRMQVGWSPFELPHPDPDGRDDEHLRAHDGPRVGLRRAHPGARVFLGGDPDGVTELPGLVTLRARTPVRVPRRRAAGAATSTSGSGGPDARHHREHRLEQDRAAQPDRGLFGDQRRC